MPKNTGKGGKSRRKGARNALGPRPLPVKTGPGEEYAQCLRMLGANRLEARCGCVASLLQQPLLPLPCLVPWHLPVPPPP